MNRTQYLVSAVGYEGQIEAMCFDGFESLCGGFEEYLSGWADEQGNVQIIVQEPDGVLRLDDGDVVSRVASKLYDEISPDDWPEWARATQAHEAATDEAHQSSIYGTYAQQHTDDYRKAVP